MITGNRKMLILAIIFISLIAMFLGCSSEITEAPPVYGKVDLEEAEEAAFTNLGERPDSISANEYNLNLKEGWESGPIAEAGSNLFYMIYKPKELSERCLECEILKINPETSDISTECILDAETFVFANELVGTKENLFWVEIGETWKIRKYNFSSHKISTIKESEDLSQTILLSAGDRYLSWFESDSAEKVKLLVYEEKTDAVNEISDEVCLITTFSRAPIQDGIITYTTKSANNFMVNEYNLDTHKVVASIDVGDEYPGNPQGNREYISWCTEPFYGNTDLFLYNIATGKLQKINDKSSATYIFSYSLIGNSIFINDRETDNIIWYGLDRMEKVNVTKMFGEGHRYILGQATSDGSFIAHEGGDELPKIIRIQ